MPTEVPASGAAEPTVESDAEVESEVETDPSSPENETAPAGTLPVPQSQAVARVDALPVRELRATPRSATSIPRAVAPSNPAPSAPSTPTKVPFRPPSR